MYLALTEVAEAITHRSPKEPIKLAAAETPWGTRYKLKVYVAESREQFAMITDLTIRGKNRLRAMGVTFAQTPFTESKGR